MRIALCQIVSGPDPKANLELVADGIRRAAEEGADLAVFPEATMACFGVKLAPLAEPLDGPWATEVRRLAREAGIAVVAGMFTPADDGRVTNTLLITGRGVEASYDKIHLFDAFGFAESNTVAPGAETVVVTLDGVGIGFTTCYDVRFPGLFQELADEGASVIVTPASWGSGEGRREQWELLVRARALDSTSWVVACGQADPRSIGREPSGKAPTGIGHSLVATPLGLVHAQLGAEPGVEIVDVDPDAVEGARQAVPVLTNRRF
ncbi:carbon-nitrogen hydrolase family protein [Saccharopolyspora karakumensis]|uniref:Carbon-nitrogen hydrolase family protein n=1 Tax=Saccharopolyspora karakumensis TaxID=2530386 RepID=A0A4R5BF11_9PSEU|nr:carbon-nitrogen hydrolase family protein [Saccharopolyspora karakumensis]TDD82394.1 carbon-nitrogen hydrolase family protein [Saccharopolyspora karakumensis]